MELSKAQMTGIISLFVIILTLQSVNALTLIPTQKAKLQTYTDTNFKPIINYKSIEILDYKINNNIIIIYLKIDGKNVRWITNLKKFNAIIK